MELQDDALHSVGYDNMKTFSNDTAVHLDERDGKDYDRLNKLKVGVLHKDMLSFSQYKS